MSQFAAVKVASKGPAFWAGQAAAIQAVQAAVAARAAAAAVQGAWVKAA